MSDEKTNELSDESMSEVNGGFTIGKIPIMGHDGLVGYVIDDLCYYYPCPNCAKPMHKSWFWWYCDPCDKQYSDPTREFWPGPAEDLIDLAK